MIDVEKVIKNRAVRVPNVYFLVIFDCCRELKTNIKGIDTEETKSDAFLLD